MASPVKALEPGSLYVTISLPYPIEDGNAASRHNLKPKLPCGLDIASYEIHCAQDLAQEEFNWGLYFHRGNQDGIWYTLTRQQDFINGSTPTLFQLSRQQVKSSPRLHCQVVGLVRVLRIPEILCRELTTYLDWLALGSYGTVTRTFIWVTSMYIRTWHHIIPKPENPAWRYGIQFDINLFLREALSFAYAEVQYTIGGQRQGGSEQETDDSSRIIHGVWTKIMPPSNWITNDGQKPTVAETATAYGSYRSVSFWVSGSFDIGRRSVMSGAEKRWGTSRRQLAT